MRVPTTADETVAVKVMICPKVEGFNDDIKAVAVPALAHRMIIGSGARIRDVDARTNVEEILGATSVPGGAGGR